MMLRWWTWRLKKGKFKAQWRAAEKLGRSGDVRAIEPLADALRGRNDSIAGRAAHALGGIPDLRAVEALIKGLAREDVRASVHESLVKLAPVSRDPLIKALMVRAESWPVDELVYGSDTSARDIAAVLKAISWTPADHRHRALLALAMGDVSEAAVEGPAAADYLSALLDHKEVRIRERAANSLKSRRDLPQNLSMKVQEILKDQKERYQTILQKEYNDIFPAAIKGDVERITELLDAGVSVEGRPNEFAISAFGLKTPLHLAAENGRARTVALLLDRGAKPDPRDELGVTPLMYAMAGDHYIEENRSAVIRALIKHGADVRAKGPGGATPQDLAHRAHSKGLMDDVNLWFYVIER
jgi:hypothetical protein